MQWSHHPTIRQGLAGVFKPHWQQLCRVVKLCILYLKDGKSLGNSHGCHTAPGGAQRGSAVELLGEDFAALQRSRRCSKPFEMGQLETLHFQRVERHKTEWMNRNQQWQKRSISAGYIYIYRIYRYTWIMHVWYDNKNMDFMGHLLSSTNKESSVCQTETQNGLLLFFTSILHAQL